MPVRRCRVSIGPDPVDELTHALAVEAASVYEAAIVGLYALQRDDWTSASVTEMSPIVVTLPDGVSTARPLRLKWIRRWARRDHRGPGGSRLAPPAPRTTRGEGYHLVAPPPIMGVVGHVPDCPHGCARGFVCEDHSDRPQDHDACGGAGMPCPDPRCPYWQGERPLALNPAVLFDAHHAGTGLPKRAGRMLKKAAPAPAAAKKRRRS